MRTATRHRVAVDARVIDVVCDERVELLEVRLLGDGRPSRLAVGAVPVADLLPLVGDARGGDDAERGEAEGARDGVLDAAGGAVGAEGVADVCGRAGGGEAAKGAGAAGGRAYRILCSTCRCACRSRGGTPRTRAARVDREPAFKTHVEMVTPGQPSRQRVRGAWACVQTKKWLLREVEWTAT